MPEDAATIVDRLTRAERIGEDVLAERQQMVELDRRRNANREALAALRRMDREAESTGIAAPEKHWMCRGDFFLKEPTATTRQLLEQDQRRIEGELEALRLSVKRKSSLLCELDPSMCVWLVRLKKVQAAISAARYPGSPGCNGIFSGEAQRATERGDDRDG